MYPELHVCVRSPENKENESKILATAVIQLGGDANACLILGRKGKVGLAHRSAKVR